MENKRKVEIFSAGCGCCEETIRLVKSIACPSCDITVLDMKQRNIAERAKSLGFSRNSFPPMQSEVSRADRTPGQDTLMRSLFGKVRREGLWESNGAGRAG